MSTFGPPLLRLAVVSALVEFLLLRFFLRLGPILPSGPAMEPVYRFVELAGVTMLNLAMLATAGLVIIIIAEQAQQPGSRGLAGVLAMALAVNLGLGVLQAAAPSAWGAIVHALVMVLSTLLIAAKIRQLSRGKLTLCLMAGGQVLALWFVLTQGLRGAGLDVPGGTAPLVLAEIAAVAAALLMPWSTRPQLTWRDAAIGTAFGLTILAGVFTRPWTIATLTMWTVSFSLVLAGPVYAVGLGIFTASLLALQREVAARPMAAGPLLVALAGLKLDFTYFSLLGLVGLLIAVGLVPNPVTLDTAATERQMRQHGGAGSQPVAESRAAIGR